MVHTFWELPLIAATVWLLGSAPTLAQEQDTYTLVIKNHHFEPSELEVPADKKIKLVVDNQDSTPEEFESHPLKLEKVVTGGRQISLSIGPLKPGSYEFVGEFHEKTAQGRLIVK